MPKIVRRYTPPAGSDNPLCSVALECENCMKITWVFVDGERSACGRCGLWFYNVDGVWMNRAEKLSAKKTVNPKG